MEGSLLRRSQKLVLGLTGVAALLATGIGSIPATHATTSSTSIAALRAKRAALVAELAAMQPGLHAAGGAVSAAENAFSTQQSKVLGEQAQLDQLNHQLMTLNQQLTANQATTAVDKHDLAVILRATWETSGGSQVLAAILSANDFTQAMDRLQNATQVSKQVTDLVAHLTTENAQIKTDQAQIEAQFAQASALQADLSGQSGRLMADLMNRNDLYSRLSGPARQIAAEIATIDNQIAADEAGPPPSSHSGGGSCGNHFAYGQCTWYVALIRLNAGKQLSASAYPPGTGWSGIDASYKPQLWDQLVWDWAARNAKPEVFITGGDAALFIDFDFTADVADVHIAPKLILEGIRLVAEAMP